MIYLLLLVTTPALNDAEGGVEGFTHRVTGLFSPAREADLREAVKRIPDLTLESIDFDKGAVKFRYDPAVFFKGVKEKDQVERFNNLLRQASSHTFGIRATGDVAWDKLTLVEIPVAGLDCRACELSAYEYIYRIDGVEQAAVSFKEGRLTARIDASKTSRDALIDALKKRQVTIKAP
jgi:hypothetical protein